MKLPTGCPPKLPTSCPPDGMWYEARRGKSLPYLARWRGTDGRKTSQSFGTAKERSDFAASWVEQRKRFGTEARLVDYKTVAMLEEFYAIVGDVNPLTVAREWSALRGAVLNLKAATAAADFELDQKQRKLSPDTHSHRELHGKRFAAYFGDRLAASITSDQLDAWLASLRDADTGRPMSPKTKAHHLKFARHFFGWLKDRRKIAHNPADAVTIPDVTEIDIKTGEAIHREINILTVEQAVHLMHANRDALCAGRLALELFGGLRYSSAARLRAADIDWAERGIVMPGHKHKSTKRHFVDGWPDNLWAWMKHAHPACWDISQRQYLEQKREAFERAGLKPVRPEDGRPWTVAEVAQLEAMDNAARHSFATYHLAAHKDPKLTAYLMTKTSVQSLNNDYRGRASKAQGDAYFAITP